MTNQEQPKKEKTKTKKLTAGFLNRYLILLSGFLGVLLLAGGYFLILESPFQNLFSLKQQTDGLDKELARLEERRIELAKEPPVNFSESEARLLNLALPPKLDVPAIIIQISQLVKNHGCQLSGLEIKPAEAVRKRAGEESFSPKISGINKVKISAKVVADGYPQLKRLLGGLESSIMLFDVNSLLLGLTEPNSQFEITTYYYPKI